MEKHQVQLIQQNRAAPFNTLNIIPVRSVLAYTQEISLQKFSVASFWSTTLILVYFCIIVAKCTKNNAEAEGPRHANHRLTVSPFSVRTTSSRSKFRSNVNILEVETVRQTLI